MMSQPNASMQFDVGMEKANRPPRPPPKSPPEGPMEILKLSHFTPPPRVDFDMVRVGHKRVRHIRAVNPMDDPQHLCVEKFPHKKNFSIDQDSVTVEAGEEVILTISWEPKEAGNCREMVQFIVNNGYRLTAVLFGKAEEPPKPKKKRGLRGRSLLGVTRIDHKENIEPNQPINRPVLQAKENHQSSRPIQSRQAGRSLLGKRPAPSVLQPVLVTKANPTPAAQPTAKDEPREEHFRDSLEDGNVEDITVSEVTVVGEKSSDTASSKPVIGATFVQGEIDETIIQKDEPEVKGAPAKNLMPTFGETFVHGGRDTIGIGRESMAPEKLAYRESLADHPIVTGNNTFLSNTPGRLSELGSMLEAPALHSTVLMPEKCTPGGEEQSPHKRGPEDMKPKSQKHNYKALGHLEQLTPIGKRQSQMHHFHDIGESIIEREEIVYRTVDEEYVEYIEEEVIETTTTETWMEDGKGGRKLMKRDEKTKTISENVQEFRSADHYDYHKLTIDDPAFEALPGTPIRRTTFRKDDPTLPNTPVNRLTFQKDDPRFPETPTQRMTFVKDDPTLPDTPVNRMTFVKDDPNLPVTPARRNTFLKQRPTVPNTPIIHVDTPSPNAASFDSLNSSDSPTPVTFVESQIPSAELSTDDNKKKTSRKLWDNSGSQNSSNRSLLESDLPVENLYAASEDGEINNRRSVESVASSGCYETPQTSPAIVPVHVGSSQKAETLHPDDSVFEKSVINSNSYTKELGISELLSQSIQEYDAIEDMTDMTTAQLVEEIKELKGQEEVDDEEDADDDPMVEEFEDTPLKELLIKKTAEVDEDDVEYLDYLVQQYLRDEQSGEDDEDAEEGDEFDADVPMTYDESLTEARNLLARESLRNPNMDESLIEVRKLLALEQKPGTELEESVLEATRLMHNLSINPSSGSDHNESISEVHNLLHNASNHSLMQSPAKRHRMKDRNRLLGSSCTTPATPQIKCVPTITEMVEEQIQADEDLEIDRAVQQYLNDSELSPDSLDDPDSPEKEAFIRKQWNNPFTPQPQLPLHVTFSDSTKKEKSEVSYLDLDLGAFPPKQTRDQLNAKACNDALPPVKYENEHSATHTVSSVDSDTSFNVEQLRESFSNQKSFDQVVGAQRLSSTPIGKEEFRTRLSHVQTPSPSSVAHPRRFSTLTVTKDKPTVFQTDKVGPVGGQDQEGPAKRLDVARGVDGKDLFQSPHEEVNPRRFSTLTVTKDKPTIFQNKEVGGQGSPAKNLFDVDRGVDGQDLFQSPQEVNPRRISTLTVTKSRPSVIGILSSENNTPTDNSFRRLFDSSDSSLNSSSTSRSQSASPVKSPKGKILPTRFASHPSPMGETAVLDHLSPSGRHISPSSPSVREQAPGVFEVGSDPCTVTPQFRPSLPETPPLQQIQQYQDRLEKGLPLESPLVILPQVRENLDFPIHSSKVTAKLVKHERGRTVTKDSPSNPTVAKPPVVTDKENKKENKERRSYLQKNRRGVAPMRRSSSSGPLAAAKQTNDAIVKRPLSVDRAKQADTAKKTNTTKPKVSTSTSKPPVLKSTGSKPPVPQGLKKAKQDVVQPKTTGDQRLNRTLALRRQAALSNMSKTATVGSVGAQVSGRVIPVKGVAKSKLVLIKKAVHSSLPKHPLPFAAKNMYYDERWMEKQERGFVRWLNFVLTPPDEENGEVKQSIDAGKLLFDAQKGDYKVAPSKETLSFRSYAAKRRLNRLRRNACLLFQSELMVKVHEKLEREVACGRVSIRKDRQVHADLGLKQHVLQLLLCYNPLWLRIGLETVYGELLPIADNLDLLGLSRFIVTRLLANPDVAAQFSHPTVPHLYKEGFAEAMNQHMLKKFLLLVLFLDKAKQNRLIDHDPCLFCKDAMYKTSRDLLVEFSRELLSGEGDICRHLGYLGYTVTHAQTARDEYDYAVTNLATDLRDGVRLTRALEFLLRSWSLSKSLRVPAISRLQKIHNVGVALACLLEHGCDLNAARGGKIDSRDVADGHREKTLQLLWILISRFQLEVLISEEELREEVSFLKQNRDVRRQLSALLADKSMNEGNRESMGGIDAAIMSTPRLQLLLQWCQAVCAYYGMKVENFTVSLSDGRALCYIVHHYHPNLLPLSSIHSSTSLTYTGDVQDASFNSEDSFSDNWTQSFSQVGSSSRPEVFEELLANERENFRLLREATTELGGIPLMLRAADMSNTIPDEKVTMTYVAYLCCRLLDIRAETRAARVIQTWWRKLRVQHHTLQQKIRIAAAKTIQRHVRDFMKRQHQKRLELQSQASGVIQHAVHHWLSRRRLHRQIQAATKIQAWVRCRQQRHQYLNTLHAVTVLQARYRAQRQARAQRQQYLQTREAVIVIQTASRVWLAKRVLHKNHCARRIQAVYRMYQARKAYLAKRRAAVTIQSYTRQWLCRREYTRVKRAVSIIQTRYRAQKLAMAQRTHYLTLKRSTIIIQKVFRGYRVREELDILDNAVLFVQRKWRAMQYGRMIFLHYHMLRGATIAIQAYVKGWQVRKEMRRKRQAATTLQASWRGYMERKRYAQREQAVQALQEWFRACLIGQSVRKQYLAQRQAAVLLQSCFRAQQQRKKYQNVKAAVLAVQSAWRGRQARQQAERRMAAIRVLQERMRACLGARKVRQQLQLEQAAALVLQTCYRRHRQRTLYLHQRSTVIYMQSLVRRNQAQTRYIQTREAANVICTRWRAVLAMRKCRQEYLSKRNACVTIQSTIRGVLARRQCEREVRNIVKVQSFVRMFVQHRQYTKLQRATQVIQKQWRLVQEARKCRDGYLSKRNACITIQSTVRGFLARKQCEREVQNIVKVQSFVRMFVQHRRYTKLQHATQIIQARWRSVLNVRKCREEYLTTRNACITIQSTVRGFLARRQCEKEVRNIVKVQSFVRMFVQHRRYTKLQHATQIFQTRWRAVLGMTKCREEYLTTRNACITIQASVRGFLARRQCEKEVRNIVKVQSCVRKFVQHRQYTKLKLATQILQTRWRSVLNVRKCREEYLTTRNACITIQASVRGFLAKKQCEREVRNIVKVQSFVRMFVQHRRYTTLKQATQVIQRRWRAELDVRKCEEDYLTKRNACTKIQSTIRGFLARRQCEKEVRNIVKVQSFVRKFVQHRRYTTLKRATQIIQTRWRAELKKCEVQYEFVEKREACVTIQAAFRGYLARRQYKKQVERVLIVQSCVRRFIQQGRYQRLKAAVTIQRRWRAELLSRDKQHEFVERRFACVKIQSVFRGYLARKLYKAQVVRIIKVQSYVKSWLARHRYLRLRAAALVVQTRWRAELKKRETEVMYLELKSACTKIQSTYRGYVAKRAYKTKISQIVKLQSVVRAYIQQQKFQALKSAALCIQRRWRAELQCRVAQHDYEEKKYACVKIQSIFRAHLARREFTKQKACIVIVQSVVRCRIQRQRFLRLKAAAVIMQHRWSAELQCRRECEKYQRLRSATIKIQAWVRCLQAQRVYTQKKEAAVCIQRAFKTYKTRQEYQEKRQACIVIQTYLRATLEKRTQHKHYIKTKMAAIKIQSCVRRYLCQKSYTQQRQAVILLQSYVKRYIVQKGMAQLRSAATVIQQHWRATVQSRIEQRQYLRTKEAVVTIQAHYKGWVQRQKYWSIQSKVICLQALWRGRRERVAYNEKKQAAVKIQCCFRGYQQRWRYENLVKATRTIQQWWKAVLAMKQQKKEYHTNLKSIVKVQTCVRNFLRRRRYERTRMACIKLQSCVRMVVARKEYQRKKSAVSVLQTRLRAVLLARRQQEQYQRLRSAAVIIQSAFRASRVQKMYSEDRVCVVKVQSCVRRFLIKRQYVQKRQATIVLQQHVRSYLIATKVRKQYLEQKEACVKIQAAYRSHLQQCRYQRIRKATVKIQSVVRMYQTHKHYQGICKATRTIQQWWRETSRVRKDRSKFVTKRKSAVKIQAYWRRYRVQRQYLQSRKAAVTIQAAVRCIQARHRFVCLKEAARIITVRWRATLLARHQQDEFEEKRYAAIQIQKYFRAYVARKEFCQRLDWVMKVQKLLRMRKMRRQFLQKKNAICLIQQAWRAYKMQRDLKRERDARTRAAVLIQSTWKGYKTQKEYKQKRQAVIILQSHVRQYQQRQKFQRLRCATLVLQQRYRANVCARNCRERFLQTRRAAVCVQRFTRGWLARKHLVTEKKRVLIVQSVVRRFLARRVVEKKMAYKKEVEAIEVRRQHLEVFTRVARYHLAASTIQRAFHNYQTLKEARHKIHNVIAIQRWWRVKLQRIRYVRFLSNVRSFKRAARAYLAQRHKAATVIQAAARRWLARRRTQRKHAAATTLQSLWRARQVRASISNARIHQARERCSMAAQHATESSRLGNRTAAALAALLTYKQLAQVLEAVQNLDVVSALSPRCCERMVEDGAVPVIYCLMKGCNRSIPHMEIVKHSVNILLNLAKYERTVSAVYSACPDAIPILLELMRIHREKCAPIFTKICTLLALFCYTMEYAQALSSNRKFMDNLTSFERLAQRQNTATQKRETVRRKMEAARSTFNSTLPLGSSFCGAPAKPRIRPAWVLGKKNKMKELTDPLQAIQFLRSILLTQGAAAK